MNTRRKMRLLMEAACGWIDDTEGFGGG